MNRKLNLTLGALMGLAVGISTGIAAMDEPPRDIRLEEKKLEALSFGEVDELGKKALEFQPQKWKHAETEHFVVHYRRATEAQKVVREVEYDLWFVARALGASKERYARKSHIFVFQDLREWALFRKEAGFPEWSGSVAHGDNLYLHVGGMGEGFDSHALAHEATHAIVARLYPGKHWPNWLNEGAAEYFSTASFAARKQLWVKGVQRDVGEGTYTPDELTAIQGYPKDEAEISRFYRSSERLVRFLMTEFPADRFPRFVDEILAGATLEPALLKVYGDQVPDYRTFLKQYSRFTK